MALTLQHPSLVIPQLPPTPVKEACLYDQRKTRLTETLVWRLLVGMTPAGGGTSKETPYAGRTQASRWEWFPANPAPQQESGI